MDYFSCRRTFLPGKKCAPTHLAHGHGGIPSGARQRLSAATRPVGCGLEIGGSCLERDMSCLSLFVMLLHIHCLTSTYSITCSTYSRRRKRNRGAPIFLCVDLVELFISWSDQMCSPCVPLLFASCLYPQCHQCHQCVCVFWRACVCHSSPKKKTSHYSFVCVRHNSCVCVRQKCQHVDIQDTSRVKPRACDSFALEVRTQLRSLARQIVGFQSLLHEHFCPNNFF